MTHIMDPGLSQLSQAVLQNSVEEVQKLLLQSVDVNAKSGLHENTALHFACESTANPELIKLLLSHGAAARYENGFQDTPLHLLCRNPNISLEAVRLLIAHGAFGNALNWRGRNVLHSFFLSQKSVKQHMDIVRLLVEQGVELNSRCEGDPNIKLLNGHTAFTFYFSNEEALDADVVKYLLRKHANPNSRGDAKYTPLHILCLHGGKHVDIAELLLQHGADVDARAKDDYTPLHVLCGRALEINPDMVKLLLQYGANVYAPTGDFGMVPPLPEYTPLHLLCRRKQVDVHVVRMLLERGAPVDATIHASITHDKCSYTPLHLLFLYQNSAPNIKSMKLLLEAGAKPNARAWGRETTLHLLCADETVSLQCAQLLLRYKADVNARGLNSRTPLHVACSSKKVVVDLIRLLVEHGAHVNARAKDIIQEHQTPLLMLCANESIDLQAMSYLISKGADVNHHGDLKYYPLHLYCKNESVTFEGLDMLVSSGATVNPKSWDGKTPLHTLCTNPAASPDLIKFLVAKGAQVDAQTTVAAGGDTPLHLCVRASSRKLVQALIECGANKNVRNCDGHLPWNLAEDDSIRELLEH